MCEKRAPVAREPDPRVLEGLNDGLHAGSRVSASAVLAASLVTVFVDGRPVEAATDARLVAGVVVAPLGPFVRDIADRIETSADGERFLIARGDRTIELRLGSNRARNGTVAEALPIAPYLRAGRTIIPLAVVARALGATVTYDARAHVLRIATEEAPLATLTPVPYVAPPPGSVPTFAPPSTPAPRPTVTGIPKPRRTPVLVEGDPPR
ncbi:MAG: hypothetical protein NVSMB19_10720 [Vulcanimicrobiaceae bacterium]